MTYVDEQNTALMELLEGLEEKDLRDPGRLSAMPQEWQPWEVFASNTYEHYEDHKTQVQAWRIPRRA